MITVMRGVVPTGDRDGGEKEGPVWAGRHIRFGDRKEK